MCLRIGTILKQALEVVPAAINIIVKECVNKLTLR